MRPFCGYFKEPVRENYLYAAKGKQDRALSLIVQLGLVREVVR